MAATFDPPPKPPRSVAFGQSTGRWSYRPRSRTYDLSVGHDGQAPGKSMVLKTTKGAEETSVIIDPGSTAFVVVDMQNFFLDPSCRDHQTGLAAVKPILEVADMCRKTGIRVGIGEPDFYCWILRIKRRAGGCCRRLLEKPTKGSCVLSVEICQTCLLLHDECHVGCH